MRDGLFITGTGTGVGKTIVTAGLLRKLRRAGEDAVSMKPVQTGAEREDGIFVAPDLHVHWEAAELVPPPDEHPLMAPYLYEPACSPHLAARSAGHYPDIAHIKACAVLLLGRHSFLLVEGAGGVLVPLDEEHTMRELMAALGFPVLLVALAGLGTINHTLLSLEALRHAGLNVRGVVLNEAVPEPDASIREDNRDTLERLGGLPVWGPIPYNQSWTAPTEAEWDALESALPDLAWILDAG